jgi:hypothetical protein
MFINKVIRGRALSDWIIGWAGLQARIDIHAFALIAGHPGNGRIEEQRKIPRFAAYLPANAAKSGIFNACPHWECVSRIE